MLLMCSLQIRMYETNGQRFPFERALFKAWMDISDRIELGFKSNMRLSIERTCFAFLTVLAPNTGLKMRLPLFMVNVRFFGYCLMQHKEFWELCVIQM